MATKKKNAPSMQYEDYIFFKALEKTHPGSTKGGIKNKSKSTEKPAEKK